MQIVFGQHAENMLIERGIERGWVERTVFEPQMVRSDPRHKDRLQAFRAIPERGGRVLRVVYAQGKDSYRIVTLFFDRAQRR